MQPQHHSQNSRDSALQDAPDSVIVCDGLSQAVSLLADAKQAAGHRDPGKTARQAHSFVHHGHLRSGDVMRRPQSRQQSTQADVRHPAAQDGPGHTPKTMSPLNKGGGRCDGSKVAPEPRLSLGELVILSNSLYLIHR